jgi:hypothetical protein
MRSMGLTDVSKVLFDGMRSTLSTWAARDGRSDALYWVLRIKIAELDATDSLAIPNDIPAAIRDTVLGHRRRAQEYWDDVRYAALDPVTVLWGTIVNAVRVVADSDRATPVQKQVFDYAADSLVRFFRASRDRMPVADSLYHAFKAMPAPECQAMAALLNVHVQAPLDVDTMCRLVRLLDSEGPMSADEASDLQAISNTHLVDAAFRGLRANA